LLQRECTARAYLAVVLVLQVEGVARERHAAGLRPLDHRGTVAACIDPSALVLIPMFPLRRALPAKLCSPFQPRAHLRVTSQSRSEEIVAIAAIVRR